MRTYAREVIQFATELQVNAGGFVSPDDGRQSQCGLHAVGSESDEATQRQEV
jgi:hypothetical protein